MQVELEGAAALVIGAAGDGVVEAVAAALAANGARVLRRDALAEGHTGDAGDPGPNILVCDARAPDSAAWLGATMDAAAQAMAARTTGGGGRIVALVPVLGLVPMRGHAEAGAAAAAAVSRVRAAAMEHGPAGVRVNAVAVGALDGAAPAGPDPGARMLSHVPLGRRGTAADVAGAVLFLADPRNAYTTGHVLAVDGGWTAGYARNF